jgi:hypothetical protein
MDNSGRSHTPYQRSLNPTVVGPSPTAPASISLALHAHRLLRNQAALPISVVALTARRNPWGSEQHSMANSNNLRPPFVLAALICRTFYKAKDGRPCLEDITVAVTRRNVAGPEVAIADDPLALLLVVFLAFEQEGRRTCGFRFVSPSGRILHDDPEFYVGHKDSALFTFPIGVLKTTETGWHTFQIIVDGDAITRTPLLVETFPATS